MLTSNQLLEGERIDLGDNPERKARIKRGTSGTKLRYLKDESSHKRSKIPAHHGGVDSPHIKQSPLYIILKLRCKEKVKVMFSLMIVSSGASTPFCLSDQNITTTEPAWASPWIKALLLNYITVLVTSRFLDSFWPVTCLFDWILSADVHWGLVWCLNTWLLLSSTTDT